jgi:beta-lactamase regulating signal transducer with metallopeptidase domain
MRPELKARFAFLFAIFLGSVVLSQMAVYSAHLLWGVNLKWNLFQYCLTLVNEHSIGHYAVKLVFIYLIAYTIIRFVITFTRHCYMAHKWNLAMRAHLDRKWTKQLNYRFREWNIPIIVVRDTSFMALATGWLKPKIMVSSAIMDMFNRREVESILLHEYCHCKKYDPLKAFIARLIVDSMGYIPLVKPIINYYKIWKEIIADRFVIHSMKSEYELSNVLLKLIHLQNRNLPLIGVHFAETAINYRILQIVEPNHPIRVPFLRLSPAVLTLCFMFLISGMVMGNCV